MHQGESNEAKGRGFMFRHSACGEPLAGSTGHTLGVAWTPGESAPRPLTTGSYVYPKGKEVGETVGLAYDLTRLDANGGYAYLGGVRSHPSLHSVWDLNRSGHAVGIASVYMRPADVDRNGIIGTNEISQAPAEWSLFNADGTMKWERSTERALSAMSSGSADQGVYYRACPKMA